MDATAQRVSKADLGLDGKAFRAGERAGHRAVDTVAEGEHTRLRLEQLDNPLARPHLPVSVPDVQEHAGMENVDGAGQMGRCVRRWVGKVVRDERGLECVVIPEEGVGRLNKTTLPVEAVQVAGVGHTSSSARYRMSCLTAHPTSGSGRPAE